MFEIIKRLARQKRERSLVKTREKTDSKSTQQANKSKPRKETAEKKPTEAKTEVKRRKEAATQKPKKETTERKPTENDTVEKPPSIEDEPHVISKGKEPVRSSVLDKFLDTYDPEGNLEFNSLQFRKGARITVPFGLENGFKMIDGQMVWGYVRLHAGVDRAGGGTAEYPQGDIPDVVQVPFHAHRSYIYEYGDTSYGTLVVLYNDTYKFEFRIAHMNPNQDTRKHNEKGPLTSWSYNRLKQRRPFERNTSLGSAGSWGHSTGAHTHTEIKSYEPKCEVLEQLLHELYGSAGTEEYTKEDVIAAYRRQRNYTNASSDTILRDYAQLREDKKTILLNPYKCEYVDWDGSLKTRYSTELLFNGL